MNFAFLKPFSLAPIPLNSSLFKVDGRFTTFNDGAG